MELGIERIPDGEVSPYFHDVLVEGDNVEVRGPIGGYFVWEPGMGGPLLLVGGGSGVVPLMAMLRPVGPGGSHADAAAVLVPLHRRGHLSRGAGRRSAGDGRTSSIP